MCQPGWEGGWGENERMYTDGWIPSLFTWNYHNIVIGSTPVQNKKFKVNKTQKTAEETINQMKG